MNIQRRPLLVGWPVLVSSPFAALAQTEPRIARIGFLSTGTAASFSRRVDAMKEGLRELGYVEGKNIAIEYRWAEFDNNRLPTLVDDLVRMKVDVIVTAATPATHAAKKGHV